ncbi:MAG: Tim44 domain-containing protein [Burkholderiales bacterium]|jgi:predicted lipid-binding transport protein (Tim44 family)|nr:Tim44 domain-containing protein [Burkholderiales bacterium]
MNKWIAALAIGFLAATLSLDAEAQRRLGGGMSFGKPSQTLQQRQATPPQRQQAPQAAPAQQPSAAGAPAAAGARAASPWRGALMGLAAGLGLAALASWLGFGEAFAMFLMVALLALLAMAAFSMLTRRTRQAQAAYPGGQQAPATWHGAGGPSFNPVPREQAPNTMARSAAAPVVGGVRPGSAMDELTRGGRSLDEPWGIPADFDSAGFLAHARTYFGRLQNAWAGNNFDELAEFTTQDMFTALTHELRARGPVNSAEVVTLEAKLLGMEHDAREHLASVRFSGTMRVDGELETFDEVWNLAKPVDGSSGWLLAGIQQLN